MSLDSALDNIVASLLASPERMQRMAEDGYRFAVQFSPDRFRKAWLEIIEGIRAH